jgi:signal transduction histidine kinase
MNENPVWIAHDDPQEREFLAVWAGGDVHAGPIQQAAFSGAPEPAAVVLSLAAPFEPAMAFAEWALGRNPDVGFVLVHGRELDAARALAPFAGLRARSLTRPPRRSTLRAALRAVLPGPEPLALGRHRQRDALLRRATRFFRGLDLDLERIGFGALSIRGEVGSGRLLLARTLHALESPGGAFVHFPCDEDSELSALAARLSDPSAPAGVVCIEEPQRLRADLQRELRGWIELGPPTLDRDPDSLLWIALVDEELEAALPLEAELETALSAREIILPPLRERPGAAERFAEDSLREWDFLRDLRGRPLGESATERLRSGAWQGNQRELETALLRALRSDRTGPIEADELGPEAPPLRAPARQSPPRRSAVAPAVWAPSASDAGVEPEVTALPDALAEDSPHLLQALGHELRNPMTTLRNYSSLLSQHFDDPKFREEFRKHSEEALTRMEERLERLEQLANLLPAEPKSVNLSLLLENLLDARRPEIQQRRLLVLRELEAERPYTLGSEAALQFALEALFDAAFSWIGDRADLYVAARHHPSGLFGGPAMRLLLRFHGEFPAVPGAEDDEAAALRASSLDFALAERVLLDQGGLVAVDGGEGGERVIQVDLPAPGE